MSKSIVVQGLVLGEIQHKEYNKIMTVLSAERGIIKVYAYGALSIKNKNFAATQPFAYSELELTEKGDGYTLKSASLIRYFYSAQRGLASNALAIYISEFLMAVCCEGNDESDMMRLALNTFHAICEGVREVPMIKAVFEVRAAMILGFEPNLEGICSECSEEKADYLDYEAGGLVCSECSKNSAFGIQLYKTVIDAMRYVISCDIKRILAFNLEENDLYVFSKAAEGYILYQLDRGFSSLEFYRQVTI
ncbi:MAG: DNA repair protein RecO [Ruminococcaceae bacterium]|nr:DNA repair protein RecO [Oscillospiraceae bacterium]